MRTRFSHRHLLLGLLLSSPLAAQNGAPAAPAIDRVATITESGTTVVATEVLVMAGPAAEPEGKAGLSFLAGRTVVAPLRERLAPLGARVGVTPAKDAIAFSLVASPDAWEEAMRALLQALFREGVDGETVESERAAIVRQLRAREANPADVARHHVDEAVFGSDHPWGRSTLGYSHSIASLTTQDVDGFLRAFFTPERATVGVVGPVRDAHVQSVLGEMFSEGRLFRPAIPALAPLESPLDVDYNTITTWVSTSYRASGSVDAEAIRFLAAVLEEDFSFDPRRRSVYNALSQVHHRHGSTELRLQLVVPPHEAREWAERVGERVDELAASPMDELDFAARVRHYRGQRLQTLGTPEARAAELARTLLVGRPLPRWAEEDAELTPARLRATAASLSEPTVVLVGPFLSPDSD